MDANQFKKMRKDSSSSSEDENQDEQIFGDDEPNKIKVVRKEDNLKSTVKLETSVVTVFGKNQSNVASLDNQNKSQSEKSSKMSSQSRPLIYDQVQSGQNPNHWNYNKARQQRSYQNRQNNQTPRQNYRNNQYDNQDNRRHNNRNNDNYRNHNNERHNGRNYGRGQHDQRHQHDNMSDYRGNGRGTQDDGFNDGNRREQYYQNRRESNQNYNQRQSSGNDYSNQNYDRNRHNQRPQQWKPYSNNNSNACQKNRNNRYQDSDDENCHNERQDQHHQKNYRPRRQLQDRNFCQNHYQEQENRQRQRQIEENRRLLRQEQEKIEREARMEEQQKARLREKISVQQEVTRPKAIQKQQQNKKPQPENIKQPQKKVEKVCQPKQKPFQQPIPQEKPPTLPKKQLLIINPSSKQQQKPQKNQQQTFIKASHKTQQRQQQQQQKQKEDKSCSNYLNVARTNIRPDNKADQSSIWDCSESDDNEDEKGQHSQGKENPLQLDRSSFQCQQISLQYPLPPPVPNNNHNNSSLMQDDFSILQTLNRCNIDQKDKKNSIKPQQMDLQIHRPIDSRQEQPLREYINNHCDQPSEQGSIFTQAELEVLEKMFDAIPKEEREVFVELVVKTENVSWYKIKDLASEVYLVKSRTPQSITDNPFITIKETSKTVPRDQQPSRNQGNMHSSGLSKTQRITLKPSKLILASIKNPTLLLAYKTLLLAMSLPLIPTILSKIQTHRKTLPSTLINIEEITIRCGACNNKKSFLWREQKLSHQCQSQCANVLRFDIEKVVVG